MSGPVLVTESVALPFVTEVTTSARLLTTLSIPLPAKVLPMQRKSENAQVGKRRKTHKSENAQVGRRRKYG
jgi:hypothetical protein